ncbi:hypothetical protein EHQ53_15635 [Leptospira langatensis]|uniref:Thioredoxin domain-containing protein n=1 Tax=Leptospira langatensis TaxID=2484983 RepID=A0A5F1ZSH2_9LEPT|nr:hypothetical protein [Leptospira langatensis]TGK01896.1 hypothetical protein EHO57_08875 [Leptospira langatensis]TGL39501.1 hypothetical protein EHQ53_15635 [Leptospira langatensis]
MESNRWKFSLLGTIAIIPLLFLLSPKDPEMILAEKEVPNEILFLGQKKESVSLKNILTGKQTLLYFGSFDSPETNQKDLQKFLTHFQESAPLGAQFVFITLAPNKDHYKNLKNLFGDLGEKIIFLSPNGPSAGMELARAFGIQSYIIPEIERMRYQPALIWVDDSPKIRGIFPHFAEHPDSINIPELLVQAK